MSLDQYISNYGREFAKKSAREKSQRSRSNISGVSPDQASAISYDREASPDNILKTNNLNPKSSVSPSNYSQSKSDVRNLNKIETNKLQYQMIDNENYKDFYKSNPIVKNKTDR